MFVNLLDIHESNTTDRHNRNKGTAHDSNCTLGTWAVILVEKEHGWHPPLEQFSPTRHIETTWLA